MPSGWNKSRLPSALPSAVTVDTVGNTVDWKSRSGSGVCTASNRCGIHKSPPTGRGTAA